MIHLPVVVVSMTNAITRREAITRQLCGYSGSWSFFEAVVPGETAGTSWHEADGARSSEVLGRPMTRGEYGCARSHLGVYERIVEHQYRAAIVLEDDALLSGDLFQVCEEALEYSQFDVLLLGYSKVSARDLCLRNLTEPMIGISNAFGRVVEAVQIGLADQPAVGVDRGRSARPQFSAADRVAHLAALAQAIALVRNGNARREIVVDRRNVDLGRRQRLLKNEVSIALKKIVRPVRSAAEFPGEE